jgi:trimethylamine--corrinoid protein Co-methyltransferase
MDKHLTEQINRQQTMIGPARRWPYRPLTEEQIRMIHDASLQILEEVGFEVQDQEAFELFKSFGARVDDRNWRVRLSEAQVNELIATVPSQLTLCGRDPEHDCTLGAGNVYFGTGGTAMNVLDYDSGERRLATLKDLVEIIRLADGLENIHIMLLPTYPNDLEVEEVDLNRFHAGLKYTSKHIMGGVYTSRGIDDVIAMAEQAAGGPEALRERPFISMISCGISPLRLCSRYGAFTIQIARQGIPLAVPVEPLCGATAPVTLAGTLVIQNCDGLINVMLSQLARPGAPVIYGSVATSVDLHEIGYLGGPVESGMLNAATAQLARFYGFPYYSTAGISDSKTLDTQCGYESAINNLLVALAGGDFIHDAAGLMEFAITVSHEKLVIDNEILGMVTRAVEGIRVDPESLAVEAIRSAGPGGHFVSSRHTRRHMRREHYTPRLSNREKREDWARQGGLTTAEQAHRIVQERLAEEPCRYIDDDLEKKLIERYPSIRTGKGEEG